jgi:pyridoxine 4-dehydrogenase
MAWSSPPKAGSCAAVTAHYNVGARTGAGLLRAAEESGLAFSPWHPATLPIPGTTSIAHLKGNLAAADIELSAEDVAAITALAPEA